MEYPISLKGIHVTIAEPIHAIITIKRPFIERLFSLDPWIKTKRVKGFEEVLADGDILKSNFGLLMNRATFNKITNNQ